MNKPRATHELLATVGKYTTQDGQEKKNYMKCGVVYTRDDGSFSIKLTALPLSKEWSGWLSPFPIDRNRTQNAQPAPTQPRPQPASQPSAGDYEDDGDIPF